MDTDTDGIIARARTQVLDARRGEIKAPQVKAFFDEATFTASYVVHDQRFLTRAALFSDGEPAFICPRP